MELWDYDSVLAYNARRLRQRPTPKDDPRLRYQVRFWLDVTQKAQYALADQIKQLKDSRVFTSTVRDALELVFSLQKGRVDLLERLFPWIVEHYRSQFAAAGQGDLNARIAKLEALLERPAPAMKSLAPPVDDDDGTLVVKKAASDGKSGQRFLDSAFSLIQ